MPEAAGPPLDFARAPLGGPVLVEASAGTGKTWTIAALVLRLLLEEQPAGGRCRIEDILVVTYTNAATAELRDRILALLLAAREGFETGHADDVRVRHALETTAGRRVEARNELDLAVASFDLAPVYTIHGFCQRALADHAFESGRKFDTEILADETTLRESAAQDFWRREMASVGPERAATLLRELKGPEGLLARARSALDRPYARVIDGAHAPDVVSIFARVRAAFARTRTQWDIARGEIVSLVTNARLRGNSYPPGELAEWWADCDRYFAGELVDAPPDKLGKLTPDALANGKTKAGSVPEHPFFSEVEELVASLDELAAANSAANANLLVRFLAYCREEVTRRKRERALQSYDDLLVGMRDALRGEAGEELAQALRTRYRAALIDEFQDTDPIQAEVLQRIWGKSGQPLYFVGDPKQAIYGFRGADVFAYLALQARARERYTLAENQRSDPPLLNAVAALFDGANPFLIPEIRFLPVAPSDRSRARLAIEDARKPFTVWQVTQEAGEKKDAIRRRIADAVASDIAELHALARAGLARLEDGREARPLAMSDIAVLVSTHSDGDVVRESLARAGFASVTYGADSVYQSHEAEDLERILRAVAEPGREALLRAALAAEPFGMDVAELAALATDGAEWEGWVARFREYHDLARSEGFVRMWRELALREGIAARLLAHADGERRMTNMSHLVELLHGRAESEGLDLAQLARVLAHARATPISDPDAEQLRLESDEDLVNIVTVFRAKGLEYAVVYCPFLWDGYQRREPAVVFHPHGAAGGAEIDLGGPEVDLHRKIAASEELAGDLRLAYVALTRARHRCTIAWGALKDAETSALAWLLHAPDLPGKDPVGELKRAFKPIDDDAIAARLGRLAADAKGALAVMQLPAAAYRPDAPGATPPVALVARTFKASVAPAWRISSFSGLVARTEDEVPDYDSIRVAASAPRRAGGTDAFGLPRGVRLGTAMHKVLEALDFAHADDRRIDVLVRRELTQAGIEESWAHAANRVVADALATRLDKGGFALRDLTRADRVDELEFTYPVRGAPASDLAAALAPMRAFGSRIPETIGSLVLAPARGFMRGFIDLVFARNGRYFIADYKSNWLGDAIEDYAPDRLAAAMADAFYDLQYLVYTVALHRLLATRLTDYDYERHFGGVYYLFLRGMRPAHGASFGVYFARPAASLVGALDACLAPDEPLLGGGCA
ncbi:MAG: exodeoxyribonuclease V subunit beta [Betaproteobacteria bacterium]|jgi:exodeoxyribonuclease V beta subunit|nr:exodeoxyribonuclease V subunit beta [Betaproteobacteria bacterium]